MFLSKFCTKILHVYFNSRFDVNSPRWVHSDLTRHLQFALRMLIAFSVASAITYATKLTNVFTLLFMIPNLTILLIQETFGSTFSTNIRLITIIVPLSILLFLLQKLNSISYHYLLGEFFYLFLTLIISYICTQWGTKKLSLLFLSLYFAAVINQSEAPSYYVFGLLGEFVIAMIVSIVVSLLVFPSFATFDIENRINYCFYTAQEMYHSIIQAFISKDPITIHLYLSRAKILKRMIRKTMTITQLRFSEITHEPTRLLQRIKNRKRRNLIDLTLQEQDDLLSLLLIDIYSLELVVEEYQLNEYHSDCIDHLKANLLSLSSSQSLFISYFISNQLISRHELNTHVSNLQFNFDSVRSSFIQTRLHRIRHTFQSSIPIQSEDHLSHAFFIFQLGSIVRLLSKSILIKTNMSEKKERKSLKSYFKIDWSRLLSAIKTTIIIGVASLFAMIPHLAKNFENGMWILVALCMSQGDTVGGAFTTMKMRLIGTLLGVMWAYVTYLSAGDSVLNTVLVLSPWMFFCGFMKLYPQWGYTVTVAASTPIVINLGRLPFADTLPAGDYALLRIKQNVIGIAIALGLTVIILPVFAMDFLKDSINTTLKSCKNSVESIVYVYNKLFEHENPAENRMNLSNIDDIRDTLEKERHSFYQKIIGQRTFLDSASVEPSFWWLNNGFSISRYKSLIHQQVGLHRRLDQIQTSLFRMNECSNIDQLEFGNLRHYAANGLFLPDLYKELANLSTELNNCLKIWSKYFSGTQTKSFQISRCVVHHREHLKKMDLKIFEQCLIDLHRIGNSLRIEYQNATNEVLKVYFQRFSAGENPEVFIPYVQDDQADSIFIALSAMYYSITQLPRAALALGITIHDIFELEITDSYRLF